MGYYVQLTNSNFRIPESKLEGAYKRMCDLNKRDDLKTGGSSTGERWFAWMPADYPSEYKDAQEILNALGFETQIAEWFGDDGPHLHLCGYDNKSGNEEHFLACISDLAVKGSFLEWQGEDGAMWKIEYGEKEPVEYSGTVSWEVIVK